MSADAQPQSLKQGMSAIGSEIFTSFERDIEDAIFETIEGEQKKHRAQIKDAFNAHKTNFGKQDRRASEENAKPELGLHIFSKSGKTDAKSPFASQIILSLAVCVFTIAAVLPVVWMLDGSEKADQIVREIERFSPDASIATGSIDQVPIPPQILDKDQQNSGILNKPNPIEHDKSLSLHAVGEGSVVKSSPEGSVIYFGSQD